MEEKQGSNGKLAILIACISIVVLALLLVGIIVFFNKPKEVVNENKTGGSVSLSYTDKKNVLSIVGATPLEDGVAIKDLTGDNYFEFSVETKLKEASEVDYEIAIKKNTAASTIADKDIKIYLEKENSGSYAKVFGPEKFTGLKKATELGTKKGEMVLTNVTNRKSIVENYRLKIWLSSTAVPSETANSYSIEILLNGKAK